MKYTYLQRTHNLKWETGKPPKVAARKMFSVITPVYLYLRVEQNIRFSHIHLNHDCGEFMQHDIALFDTFKHSICSHSNAKNSETNLDQKKVSGHKGYY